MELSVAEFLFEQPAQRIAVGAAAGDACIDRDLLRVGPLLEGLHQDHGLVALDG